MRDIYTLFDAASVDVYSKTFVLDPGWGLELSAFGFSSSPMATQDGAGKARPSACVNKLIVKQGLLPPPSSDNCGAIFDFPVAVEEIIAEGRLMIHGCPVSLWAGNTVEHLLWPGVYRVVLSTEAILGDVQIFASAFVKRVMGPWRGPHDGN
jgi:hypothetical protein